ncbi:hypothetical protein BKP45_13790 [Anaerobacillus alkalidiazotrophicus]|uniref:Spo0E family sporulation regulatory protein-aspartic acid phosphatase n=1 Tax=Anaerobacillus alkalidiazotrophicus TaxID=472963 RepID=A0A1S2M3Q5_9BACI|nr:aspartyl-phosphate phosphatase Spo0E family protein [Anaerobacillus alkalidiazotrophicus]OIJ19226.1 hypothetical protein BKP45_13790 [Anaerobacillus alkalidiazotrophicus]
MLNTLSLIEKIEEKRREMLQISLNYGISSKQTIKCSQELDDLLNLYDKLKNYTSKTYVILSYFIIQLMSI